MTPLQKGVKPPRTQRLRRDSESFREFLLGELRASSAFSAVKELFAVDS